MKISIAMKSLFTLLCYRMGWVRRRLRRIPVNDYVVLMYHRIIPHDEARKGVQPGMYVTPETFERHALFLKKYFNLCSISSLRFEGSKASPSTGFMPRCILTFDDGWRDFYDNAFPILIKHEIPATVFLPTAFIGTSRRFWTDRLAFMFYESVGWQDSIHSIQTSQSPIVRQLGTVEGSIELRLDVAIELMKSFPETEIEGVMEELSSILNVAPTASCERAFLSWKEVKEMLSSGIITFGSHTAKHRILTNLSEREVERELSMSREKLLTEGVVDPTFIPFCYPNGNYTDRISKMVQDAGYALAVTTKNGWNKDRPDRFSLRRVGIHQDMSSTIPLFGCRILGLV